MKTITTQGKELLIVEVPEDEAEYIIRKDYYGEVNEDTAFYFLAEIDVWGDGSTKYSHITDLPKGEFKLLGTVTKEGEVGFELEPYVLKSTPEEFGGFYDYESWEYEQPSSFGSFITLLRTRGIGIPDGKKLVVLEKLK